MNWDKEKNGNYVKEHCLSFRKIETEFKKLFWNSSELILIIGQFSWKLTIFSIKSKRINKPCAELPVRAQGAPRTFSQVPRHQSRDLSTFWSEFGKQTLNCLQIIILWNCLVVIICCRFLMKMIGSMIFVCVIFGAVSNIKLHKK